MKCIGLVGGMSWESTAEYYRLLNKMINEELGGLHSAKVLLYSVDFHEIEVLQHLGDWAALTKIMIEAAKNLESAGAQAVLICTNTMHKMADEVSANLSVPLLHIADAAALEIKRQKKKTVGLLGTRFTMEQDFYKGRLKDIHDIDVMIPNDADMDIVHEIIYGELCKGNIKESSRSEFKRIIEQMADAGADGVILGCTEIPLLIKQEDVSIPVYDTTLLHAEYAVNWALEKELS